MFPLYSIWQEDANSRFWPLTVTRKSPKINNVNYDVVVATLLTGLCCIIFHEQTFNFLYFAFIQHWLNTLGRITRSNPRVDLQPPTFNIPVILDFC